MCKTCSEHTYERAIKMSEESAANEAFPFDVRRHAQANVNGAKKDLEDLKAGRPPRKLGPNEE